MYVFAPAQVVKQFPYSVDELRKAHPNVSFPQNPSEQLLAEWSVFPVIPREAPPFDYATRNCQMVEPTLENGQWVQRWEVTPATDDEIAERTEQQSSRIRAERNQRLTDCDWTQLPDAPVDPAPWAVYRQTLRDITAQAGFPWDVTWPEVP